MSSNIVKTISKKSGKSVDQINKFLIEAELVVKLNHPDMIVESNEYSNKVETILKFMSGIRETPIITIDKQPETYSMSITEALNEVTKNPFKIKSNIIFIDKSIFIGLLERLTEYTVNDISRDDQYTFVIEFDDYRMDVSDNIKNIQYMYADVEKDQSLFDVVKINSSTYRIVFTNKVVMK